MITISIDTDLIFKYLDRYSISLELMGIKNLRVEGYRFVCVYMYKTFVGELPIKIEITPKADQAAQNILLDVYADTAIASRIISAIAASEIAARIPKSVATNNQVIIPTPDFASGVVVQLNKHHLLIKMRTN